MLPTRWADWAGEAEAAYQRLAQRATHVVVVGLSMGGALTLRLGADHPDIAGLVCINPVTKSQPPEVIDMLRGMVDGGTAVMPGIGSDIADPDAKENAYEGTPLEPLMSMLLDGVVPLAGRVPRDAHAAAADDVTARPCGGAVQRRLPRRHLWRPCRADHARTQLPRRHPGLRQGTDLRSNDRVRQPGRGIVMSAVLASIPSPSSGALTLGPLSIHAYGLMIALGVIAAVWLFGRRLELMHIGTREDASAVAVWAVVAGVIGSRLYHVVTDWSSFEHDLGRIPQLWRGGLGIPGGILFGTLAALYAFKRRGIPPALGVERGNARTAVGPGDRPLGQLVEPGTVRQGHHLAVGLRIDADKIPAGYRRARPSIRPSCTSHCGASVCASRCW